MKLAAAFRRRTLRNASGKKQNLFANSELDSFEKQGGNMLKQIGRWKVSGASHHRKAAPSRQLANCRGVVRRPRRSDLPPQGAVPQVIGAQRARRVGVSRGVRWPVVVHCVHHAIGTSLGTQEQLVQLWE